MNRRGALTLVEVLISVAILILLAGILVAVTSHSVTGARMADARVTLRQLGVASLLYREERGGYPLFRLDPLFKTGYILEKRLLLVPGDPYPSGYGRFVYDCTYEPGDPNRTELDTSFEDVFMWSEHTRSNVFLDDMIRPLDDDPALIVTRVFGEHDGSRIDRCDFRPRSAFCGRTIRFHEDGSVRTVDWWDGKRGDRSRHCLPALFSNLPGDVVCERGVQDPKP